MTSELREVIIMMDFNKTQIFQRHCVRLNKKELCTHLYMPWSKEIDLEFLFKVKAAIRDEGYCLLPLMDLSGKEFLLEEKDLFQIKKQLQSSQIETHLVMFNQKVIHVLNVDEIVSYQDVSESKFMNGPVEKDKNNYHWLKVSDLYVLNVDHMGLKDDINNKLLQFMQEDQHSPVFERAQIKHSTDISQTQKKWVRLDRHLTYDYFMRVCELEETIYPNCWQKISRKSQHHLVLGELLRKEAISFRNAQKWESLKDSFVQYRESVVWELNEIYVFPLVDAITRFESFNQLWKQYVETEKERDEAVNAIHQIVTGERQCIDYFNEFLYFMDHIKSMTFSIKNRLTKKSFSEEFLIIEKFLNKQEQKIESFKVKNLSERLKMLNRIMLWVSEVDEKILNFDVNDTKSCNLKLTHLLSLMNSSSDESNLIFALIEEKAERSCSSPSLSEEVKKLFSETVAIC